MKKIIVLFVIFCSFNCNSYDDEQQPVKSVKILSLGDSYTIGESVCETCRFPYQLKDSLKNRLSFADSVDLDIIAQTGWSSTSLLNAINSSNLNTNYDIVTLLIGVNNQFLGFPFSIYETEFPELVSKAIELAQSNSTSVIVISIPDYLYTTYGELFGDESISSEIDACNAFAEGYCNSMGVTFINITDITRDGLVNPELVASDGLHPSELAYSLFVERIAPVAFEKLQ